MRAITVTRPGGPDVLSLATLADPSPSDREILVEVSYSGVNRADILQRRGLYAPPPGASLVPGLEFAGVIQELGAAATRFKPGDRVMGIVAGGGYARRLVTHEDMVVGVPEAMPMVSAGAIPEAYMTAYDALFRLGALGARETCLIHAVGSGVGVAALQLANRAGARTIGTSRTQAKIKKAREMGLDIGIHADPTGGSDWHREVLRATADKGVDVILDLVGGPYLEGNQAAIATRGRHIVVGIPGGTRAQLDLRALMTRRASLAGTVLRSRSIGEKAALTSEFDANVMPGFRDGTLEPAVDGIWAAAQVAEAHRRMEGNRNFGKILLAWER